MATGTDSSVSAPISGGANTVAAGATCTGVQVLYGT